MSTLVMVERDRVACIAADSLTTFGSSKQSSKYLVRSEKILHVGDSYIGIVGLAVSRTILESVFEGDLSLPEVRSELELFEFARKLHRKLKDEYFLKTGDSDFDAFESSQMTLFLLNRHGMFGLHDNRSVEQFARFAAVGSGAEYALGAMYAAYEVGAEVEDIARLGVEAGAEFDQYSQTPITIKKLKLEQ